MTGKKTGQAEKDSAFVAGWSAAAAARLKAAIKRFGSQAIVAERALISRQSLVEILRFDEGSGTGSRPRYKTLSALCEILDIERDELINAANAIDMATSTGVEPTGSDVELEGLQFELIKRYDIDASAGPGRFPLTEDASYSFAVARSWLTKRGLTAGSVGLVSVNGDSMLPTVPDGALALLQFVREFDRPGIYVFSREGAVGIKRFKPVGKRKNGSFAAFIIMSDNPAYEPELVSGARMDDIRFIGRVKSIFADIE